MNRRFEALLACTLWLAVPAAHAQSSHEHHHQVSDAGVVMNENTDRLPRGCTEVSEDVRFEVRAGQQWAVGEKVFGFSQYRFEVPPCARVEVQFSNDDSVRHQWMVHGLPSYLYPAGMFHLEASGGQQVTGRFIVPADDRTYLVHCDMAQHMEKGMRGQLTVGRGSGDLWAVPGISGDYRPERYAWPDHARYWPLLILLLVVAFRPWQ